MYIRHLEKIFSIDKGVQVDVLWQILYYTAIYLVHFLQKPHISLLVSTIILNDSLCGVHVQLNPIKMYPSWYS